MEKMNIRQILDRLNEEVGYKGLDNTGKNTEDRDDVVSRQAFNNWIREYKKITDGSGRNEIKPIKVNQFETLYFKADVERIIKIYRSNLKKAFKMKTVELPSKTIFLNGKEITLDQKGGRIAKTLLDHNPMTKMTEEEVKQFIDNRKKEIIESLLDMKEVEYYAIQSIIDGHPLKQSDLFKNCIKKAPAD